GPARKVPDGSIVCGIISPIVELVAVPGPKIGPALRKGAARPAHSTDKVWGGTTIRTPKNQCHKSSLPAFIVHSPRIGVVFGLLSRLSRRPRLEFKGCEGVQAYAHGFAFHEHIKSH